MLDLEGVKIIDKYAHVQTVALPEVKGFRRMVAGLSSRALIGSTIITRGAGELKLSDCLRPE